jgi:hypothetical protein
MTILLAFILAPAPKLLAEEPPPAEKVEAPAEKKAEAVPEKEYDIGKKLDGETVTKLITLISEAATQKGSFWRNPSLWEAIWLIVLLILGALAAYFGWKKRKWGKIIVAIQKAVNTIYIEWVREAKLKAKQTGGKLSKEDMLKALQEAWDMTNKDLLAQGINLAKWITREYFPTIVNSILQKAKKKGT